jgi:hypothetical protein
MAHESFIALVKLGDNPPRDIQNRNNRMNINLPQLHYNANNISAVQI